MFVSLLQLPVHYHDISLVDLDAVHQEVILSAKEEVSGGPEGEADDCDIISFVLEEQVFVVAVPTEVLVIVVNVDVARGGTFVCWYVECFTHVRFNVLHPFGIGLCLIAQTAVVVVAGAPIFGAPGHSAGN